MNTERPNHITASQLGAIALCPGRWRMSKQAQTAETSEYAAHGSRVHELLRHRAISGEFDFSNANNQERNDALACWALVEKLLADIGTHNYEVLCAEERMYSSDGLWSGQPDLVLKCNSRLIIIDYKTGHMDVTPSAQNTQLQALAVLAADRWRCNEIIISIIAPFSRDKISAATMNEKIIDSVRGWINHVVQSAMKPDAELRPGEPQCRYCPARSTCPELAKWAVAPVEKAVPQLTSQKADRAAITELARGLSIEQCAEMWTRRQAVQWVYDAVEQRLQSLSDEQLERLGLTRAPGRVIRNVRDVTALFHRLKSRFGMDAATFTQMCSVNLGQIGEWLAKQSDMSPTKARLVLARMVADICEEKQARPSIKPKSDENSQNGNKI